MEQEQIEVEYDEIFEVVRLGHPSLRKVAVPVPEEMFGSEELRKLENQLIGTMLEAGGVGLAAPQVALELCCFAYYVPAELDPEELEEEDDDEIENIDVAVPPQVLFNPTITPLGLDQVEGWEGCLSIPGMRGSVPRFARIQVDAFDVEGNPLSFEASDFHARVIQHEYDHLEGVIFMDRMHNLQSLCFEEEWEAYVLESDDEEELE